MSPNSINPIDLAIGIETQFIEDHSVWFEFDSPPDQWSTAAMSWNCFGQVIAKLGNFAEARADYQRSVALEVRSLLALIYNLFTTQPSQRVEIPDMDKLASEGRVSKLVYLTQRGRRIWLVAKTLEGPFSTVSKLILKRKSLNDLMC